MAGDARSTQPARVVHQIRACLCACLGFFVPHTASSSGCQQIGCEQSLLYRQWLLSVSPEGKARAARWSLSARCPSQPLTVCHEGCSPKAGGRGFCSLTAAREAFLSCFRMEREGLRSTKPYWWICDALYPKAPSFLHSCFHGSCNRSSAWKTIGNKSAQTELHEETQFVAQSGTLGAGWEPPCPALPRDSFHLSGSPWSRASPRAPLPPRAGRNSCRRGQSRRQQLVPSPRPGDRRANEGGAAADSGAELGASPPGSALLWEPAGRWRGSNKSGGEGGSGAGVPSRPTALWQVEERSHGARLRAGGSLGARPAPLYAAEVRGRPRAPPPFVYLVLVTRFLVARFGLVPCYYFCL